MLSWRAGSACSTQLRPGRYKGYGAERNTPVGVPSLLPWFCCSSSGSRDCSKKVPAFRFGLACVDASNILCTFFFYTMKCRNVLGIYQGPQGQAHLGFGISFVLTGLISGISTTAFRSSTYQQSRAVQRHIMPLRIMLIPAISDFLNFTHGIVIVVV